MSVNRELIEVFNDCVNRMNAGQSAVDCLQLYPQYADQLRPMLETIGAARRGLTVDREERIEARERIRQRLLNRQPAPVRRVFPLQMFGVAAATLLILFFVTSLIAETSLPGDPLYSIKRVTEGIRETVLSDPQLFEARRIEEIQRLLESGREAEVAFVGEIEAIEPQTWTIAGLPMQVENVELPQLEIGTRVSVEARTQSDRTLRAVSIKPEGELPPVEIVPNSTAAPTSTVAPTLTTPSTAVPTFTLTRTPAPTQTRTAVPTRTQTLTPRPTITGTNTPTRTGTATLRPTVTATRTPLPTQRPSTNTPTGCVVVQPSGWITYRVEPGDTLSGLAVETDTTLEKVIQVNCIANPSILIVGQTLFLPMIPVDDIDPTSVPEDDSGDDDNIPDPIDDDENDDPTREPEDEMEDVDPTDVPEDDEGDDDPTDIPEDDEGDDDPPPVEEEEEEDDDIP
jgi:LysM repeat protein